jgi:hypothetical protein
LDASKKIEANPSESTVASTVVIGAGAQCLSPPRHNDQRPPSPVFPKIEFALL